MIPYPTDHDDPGAATAPGRARAAVDPVLRACLHTLPEAVRVVCAYQLGWGDRTGAPTGRGTGAGRAIGPALVLAAARAAGGPEEAALPAAAAVELVHQSTLLHAGVTGRAPGARRRPPTRAVFGTTGAGAAGDAMAALAVRLVAGRPEAVTLLCDRLIELCGARAARHAVGPAAALPGPGALFGLACALGGIHAGASPRVTAALDAFGRAMGAATAPTPAPRAAPLARLTPTTRPAPAAGLAPTALPTPATRLAPAAPTAPPTPSAPGAGAHAPAGARYTAPAGPGSPLEQLARALPGPGEAAELAALYRLVARTDP
ncbi:polyprenyl synthetase family protein [Streptomyces lavendulae]|uniref:polyprenyl synthetase family protein n=1 Tax=Streptomyces lavendulae TaxID=1914 RepID=UPI0033F9CAF4